ncbi:MAG TPA: histidine kinase, partial [Puia sp.]|nr:histidine kinase [Puia sp.]
MCKIFYFPPVIILFLFCYGTYAQRIEIDSLKKVLPALHDSAEIDCLNTLSLIYTYLQTDTAELYAQKAYDDASKINYPRGLVMSLNNKAHIAGLGYHNFPLQEKISLQTIHLYKNLKDEESLAATYMNLALALFCQSYFDRSSEACDSVIRISQKTNNLKEQAEAIAITGSINFESGNYEKSFVYFNQSLNLFKSINDSYNTAILLAKIGDFYRLSGDQKTAVSFYFQSLKYPEGPSLLWHPLVDLGDTYYALEEYDSAFYDQDKYVQAIKSLTIRSNYESFPKILMAEMNIASRNYTRALTLLIENLKQSEKNNDKNQMMRSLLDIGKVYEEKDDYRKAFSYIKNLLQNAQTHKAKQYLRDGYKLMYVMYNHLHKTDNAYFYYRQYTYMKESVALSDFSKKLAIYEAATESEKKQAQITALNNEKLIDQQKLLLSEQQLKSESFLKNIFIGSVLVLLLFGFILYRNARLKQKNEASRHEIVEKELTVQKLESERTKIELQQRSTELEMQALRAQMNPHFIFNCLNSINRFTLTNEAIKAADYLTKFAKLIRIVLQQSGKSFIPLEDELYSLQLYMDLEALRFEIPFIYKINSDNINPSEVMVPPLLLQPFVENAIWHGLHPKENETGKINIDFKLCDELLHCSICDNGVGRIHSMKLTQSTASEKKS